MRRPLFFKIFLWVAISFLLCTNLVSVVDSILNDTPSRTAERTAQLGLSGAAAAMRLGGEQGLRDLLATWPRAESQRVTWHRMHSEAPPHDDRFHGIFATTAVDPNGDRYAITYLITRFHGFAAPPLVADMGPRVFLGTVVGTLLFSALLAFYLTVPISRIRQGFRRLAAGDLKARLGPGWYRRRDEIADLATDFDQMADRLEELVASRDRLLADIAHELRSPLARLQLAIELARQSPEKTPQSLQRIDREADKLEEMVGELLALSRLEIGATRSDEYFSLSEVVRLVVEDARFEAQEKGVRIDLVGRITGGHDRPVMGSGRLVSRAIENIVRNALRFSRRGEVITVEMSADAEGSCVAIRDQGPGVESGQLAGLFEPFVQAQPAAGQGYGLGLSIAKRAIIAHRGTIEASNGVVSGLAIRVWLPSGPDAPDGADDGRGGLDGSLLSQPA